MNELSEFEGQIKQILRSIIAKNQLQLIRLESIGWLDDYNGRSPSITAVHGVPLSDISGEIQELANIVYDGECVIDGIYATVEQGIVIQFCRDAYNQYGNYVGTEKWWTKLTTLTDMAKRKIKKLNIHTLKQSIQRDLEKL